MTPLGSVFRAKVSAVYVVALACVVTCVTWCACADGPDGKNNGTVEGVQYFRCKLNYGLFVRPSACVVLPQESSSSLSSSGRLSSRSGGSGFTTPNKSTAPRTATSSVRRTGTKNSTPRSAVKMGATPSKKTPSGEGFGVGSKVLYIGKFGTVRYIGEVDGAVGGGVQIGIELATATGKNDGSVNGVRYFKAKENCGLFAKPERCTWRGLKVSTLL
eukprot:m.581852 g.581852  ORF g.581852 m.581852 type:complete len:216 (+) comp22334_c1_seq5:101-748(+)